jgi:hypothetical protein
VELAALERTWRNELERLGLVPSTPDREEPDGGGREQFGIPDVEKLAAEPFVADTKTPNGSSIAFLACFGGKRILLAGDAHSGRIESSLRCLGWSESNRLPVDCWKLSHHGSSGNTSPTLLNIIDCARFAISTDGTRHGHPDPQTIARILKADPARPKELVFNVRQPNAVIWDVESLKRAWNYRCTFPLERQDGVTIHV